MTRRTRVLHDYLQQKYRWLHSFSRSAGPLGKIWWFVFCVAFGAIGISLLGTGYSAFSASQASRMWSESLCIISDHQVHERYYDEIINKRGKVRRTYYAIPEVQCEYPVRKLGSGESIQLYRYKLPLKQEFRRHARAENIAAAKQWMVEVYPHGMQFELVYNPENPHQVLTRFNRLSWKKNLLFTGTGIAFVTLAGGMVYVFFMPTRCKRHNTH